ncbi:hypothetical protein GW755_03510 [bacterium]|nr:hypothetical protein [bacterium]
MLKTWLFSILLLILSGSVLYYKGYFNISHFIAKDPQIQDYLNTSFANKIPFYKIKSYGVSDNLAIEYSWIKNVNLKLKPNLSVAVNYELREVLAISDKKDFYIDDGGVLFSKPDFKKEFGTDYPTFIYGGQEIGDNVFRPEEISYLKELKIYPKVTLSHNNSIAYIKPIDYNWFLEVVALMDSHKSSQSTNQLLKELNESGKTFSSILVMGDRLIVKD